jgi:hypothetical protein
MNSNDENKNKCETIKLLLEIPVIVEQKIQQEAQLERRSRHAQIVRALEERYHLVSVEPQPQTDAAQIS